jgi:hypothetical protein
METSNPADGHNPHPSGNGGIPMLSESGQSGTQPIAQPCTDRIRFRCPISESVHGNRRSDRRPQSALILKRRNPAAPGPRPASRRTGHGPEVGPNPILAPDSRFSPREPPLPQTATARSQPETAESRGSLIIADQPRSRALMDSSVPLDPKPISVSDPRTSSRKQAVRQR